MPDILTFDPSVGVSALLAGLAGTNALDALEIDYTGAAYACQVTDYAAVSAVGQIVAETVLAAASGPTAMTAARMSAAQRAANGDLYFVSNKNGAATGVTVTRYNSAGAVINHYDVTTDTVNNPRLAFLPTGNLLVSYIDISATDDLTFAILDPYLNLVAGPTNVEAVAGAVFSFSQAILSGGGFAFCYQLAGGGNERLAVYANDGSVVAAPATIMTWTGTLGQSFSKMTQLSSGAIGIGLASTYGTTHGSYYGVYPAAGGAAVQAVTQYDATTPSATALVEIAQVPGFFAVATANATSTKTGVFSNLGVQQGGTFTHATVNCQQYCNHKLLSDTASRFFLFDMAPGSGDAIMFTAITSGGSAGTPLTTFAVGAAATAMDAAFDRGRIALIAINGTVGSANSWSIGVFNPTTNVIEKALAGFGTTPSVSKAFGSIQALGDFSFLAYYEYDTSNAFYIGKYSASAVIGQSQNLAVASTGTAYVKTAANAYVTNPMIGSASVAFDHSAATPHGNKGTLMLNGLSLKGM